MYFLILYVPQEWEYFWGVFFSFLTPLRLHSRKKLPKYCIAWNHLSIAQGKRAQRFFCKLQNSTVTFSSIKLSQLTLLRLQWVIFPDDAAKSHEATSTDKTFTSQELRI